MDILPNLKIAFVGDPLLPAEKARRLLQTANQLRTVGQVELLKAAITEDELLHRLDKDCYDLVLLPWHLYLSWSRVEAFFGMARKSGPTTAGYFAEPIAWSEFQKHSEQISQNVHLTLLDFGQLDAREIRKVVQALINEHHRTMLHPLLQNPETKIYHETWGGSGGARGYNAGDGALSLPIFAQEPWKNRINSVRICLTALWSLIYEEGPGKGELNQAVSGSSAKAYFQVGANEQFLGLRLCFQMPAWNPKGAFRAFQPNANEPITPARLLLRFADFVRVHASAETNDVEITLGFFPTAPAAAGTDTLRTLWIEPLAQKLMFEMSAEQPMAQPQTYAPLRREFTPQEKTPNETPDTGTLTEERQNNAHREALGHVSKLRQLLLEREEQIDFMKRGGVGLSTPIAPPDAESLLEAFQERYLSAQDEMNKIQAEIERMSASGEGALGRVAALRKKISDLTKREKQWIRMLADTIALAKQAKKTGKSGGEKAG